MFVILGATGKAGRTTINQLRSQGAPVRAVVRKGSNADELSALGCEIAAADLNESASIKTAIRGADAVQVICPVQAQAEDAAGAMGKTIDARLVFDLYVAHNAGRIDVEPGATDIRFGTTELRDVFASLLGR
jgi:uncharacterized protein YbjT (DUF2867 family)